MIKYTKISYEDIFKPPMMSMFVISACNLQCEECIMMNQMHLHPSYQMSLEEMEKFLYYTEKSGYRFNYRYTGGEPLYWRNLKDGTKMLRKSKSCNSILLMTNGMKHENLNDEIIRMIDYVRISQYNYNDEAISLLKEKYPHKVKIVDREKFYPNPLSPIHEAVPVECGNLEHIYFNKKIYMCPHSYSLSIKHNLKNLELGIDLCDNYCDRNLEIREGHELICKLCLGNKKVRDNLDMINNVSNRHEKLVQLNINKIK